MNTLQGLALNALKRFPYTFVCGLAAAVYFAMNQQLDSSDEITQIEAVLLTAIMGIPLSLGVIIATENRAWRPIQKSLLQTALVFLPCLALLAYLSSGDSWSIIWRYNSTLILAHLVMTYAVNLKGDWSGDSYWNFNFLLLKKFIFATLVAGGWFLGSMAIFGTIEILFRVGWLKDIWGSLFGFSAFVLHPIVFCSSFPSSFEKLKNEEHPKPVRLLAQYVLLPVVFIYFMVLYAYFSSALMGEGLPRGLVGAMTLSAAVVGLLTFITLIPLERSAQFTWVKKVSWVFHALVLPLLILSFWSVWVRAHQYGLTEPRYAMYLFTGWFIVIALVRLTGQLSFMRMHLSFFAVLLMATVGPLSLVDVSLRSQSNQLREFLAKHKLANERGEIAKGTKREMPQKEINRFHDFTRYFTQNHARSALTPFLDKKSQEGLESADIEAYYGYWQEATYINGLLVLVANDPPPATSKSSSSVWWSSYSEDSSVRLGNGYYAPFSIEEKKNSDLLRWAQLRVSISGVALLIETTKGRPVAQFDLRLCEAGVAKGDHSIPIQDPRTKAWLVVTAISCTGQGKDLKIATISGHFISQ
jgi:hypothetical protein